MIRAMVFTLAVLAVLMLCQVVADDSQATMSSVADPNPSAESVQRGLAMERMDLMPLAFTENQGQWDERVKFRANAGGATVWFTTDGVYHQFTRQIPSEKSPSDDPHHMMYYKFDHEPNRIEQLVVKASFVDANPDPTVVGDDLMEYKCNYFISDDRAKWHTDVPNFRAVRFEKIYPHVDLIYYGNDRLMEYDLVVSPGGDISEIEIRYEGAKAVWMNSAGELVVETEWNRIVQHAPIIYQLSDGERISISGEYRLVGDNSFGFALGNGYDPSMPVIIDPTLAYSTYLGGSDADIGHGISVDRNGNAYVTGHTASADFPTLNPYQTDTDGAYYDVFITKLNREGDGLVYSTYLGGNSDDHSRDIAVDGDGNAYITGNTASSDFPTHNPYQTHQGESDVFVAKLNTDGNGLVYSTYLGGNSSDCCYGIAVDGNGNAYVTGNSSSSTFPVVNPYQAVKSVYYDVIVAKLNTVGDDLVYSTFLGGDYFECGHGIAVDSNGNAYITGVTESSDFPTHNAYQTDHGDGKDAFITKLDDQGSRLIYSTYLGKHDWDYGFGIAVDDSGNVFVTGMTGSSDFPTLNPYQTYQGDYDVFVAKFNADCSGLLYSTFLGGSDYDWCRDLAVDRSGNACVTGATLSSDFPTVNPYQTDQWDCDVFVTKLNSDGNGLIYSTYLGGDDIYEGGSGIAVDDSGNLFVTGSTGSTDFPLANPYMTDQGSTDAFVVKLTDEPSYLCGDADGSGELDVDDVVYLIAYIFSGGPPPDPYHAGDADCSGGVDIDDVVWLINYIFSGSNAPCDTDGDEVPDC